MAKKIAKKVEFCGAFNGTTTLRPGESLAQAADRIQDTMQRVLDVYAKRLQVAVGVDYGEIHEQGEPSGGGVVRYGGPAGGDMDRDKPA